MRERRDMAGPAVTAGEAARDEAANARRVYMVSRADLPVSCPMPGMPLWNSHPRVYLAFADDGIAHCPYCGAEYVLKETGEQQ